MSKSYWIFLVFLLITLIISVDFVFLVWQRSATIAVHDTAAVVAGGVLAYLAYYFLKMKVGAAWVMELVLVIGLAMILIHLIKLFING